MNPGHIYKTDCSTVLWLKPCFNSMSANIAVASCPNHVPGYRNYYQFSTSILQLFHLKMKWTLFCQKAHNHASAGLNPWPSKRTSDALLSELWGQGICNTSLCCSSNSISHQPVFTRVEDFLYKFLIIQLHGKPQGLWILFELSVQLYRCL